MSLVLGGKLQPGQVGGQLLEVILEVAVQLRLQLRIVDAGDDEENNVPHERVHLYQLEVDELEAARDLPGRVVVQHGTVAGQLVRDQLRLASMALVYLGVSPPGQPRLHSGPEDILPKHIHHLPERRLAQPRIDINLDEILMNACLKHVRLQYISGQLAVKAFATVRRNVAGQL
uniref:Uncharacterized protein n=1 Tax=Anopheles merus TaxID=30066 RepID=A0A182UV63_ANOME